MTDKHFTGMSGPPPIKCATQEETTWRHHYWKERRWLMSEAMALASTSPIAMQRFTECGADAWVEEYTDDEGGYRIRCQHCKSRWCEPCGRGRALTIAENLRRQIGDEPHLHVVLTLKHRDEPLTNQLDRLLSCFKALRGTRLWKNATDGGAAFIQAHVGRDGLWHPHIHATIRSKWLSARSLSEEWCRLTGDSDNVAVSVIHDKAGVVREVTRYVSRPIDWDKMPTRDAEGHIHPKLIEFIVAMKGRRLCLTFGRWRGFKLTAIPEQSKRPSRIIDSLTGLIARVRAGDVHAYLILDILQNKSLPKTGPPARDPNG